jgi:hypothetical protein
MAKIISFNTDAPGLKPQSKPHDGLFDIDAQLQHASFGKKGKDVQSIRVRASGGLLLYEQRFPTSNTFATWLRSGIGISEANIIADQVMSGGLVKIPLCYRSEDELIEDGFKPIIIDSAPRQSDRV